MLRLHVSALVAMLACSCGHAAAVSRGETEPDAGVGLKASVPDPAKALGAADGEEVFSAAGSGFAAMLGSSTDAANAYLGADVAAFVTLAALADKGRLDGVAFVRDVKAANAAGFITEYVITFYFNPLWKLPWKKPLRLREFLTWQEQNVVEKNPPAFVLVQQGEGGKQVNAAPRQFDPGLDWPEVRDGSDAVLTGSECGPHLPVFVRFADSWPPRTSGGGRPVSAHFTDYLAYVEKTATEGMLRGFPELVSPSYFVAAFTLERCAARDGGDREKWFALASQMNPALAHKMDEAVRRIKEAQTTRGSVCPGPEAEVNEARCEQDRSAVYGYSLENPLEIGLAAGGQSLWYGRLLCPNRSTPSVRRLGNVGPPPKPSQSPLSPVGGQGVELLDQWEVFCPGIDDPFVLYSNLYRCGLNCPPMHFHVLSAEAYRCYQRSLQLAGRGKLREAVLELERLPDDQLHTELVLAQIGGLYLEQTEAENARTYLDAALKLNPDEPRLRLSRAKVDELAGKLDEYLDALERLLVDVGANHELRPELLCRKAQVLAELGRKDEAAPLMSEACQLGQDACCL